MESRSYLFSYEKTSKLHNSETETNLDYAIQKLKKNSFRIAQLKNHF